MIRGNYIFTQEPSDERRATYRILCGDTLQELKRLPERLARCVITSPPYGRKVDYGVDGQYGLEGTVDEYIAKQVEVARELYRVTTDDANLFWVIQDSRNNSGGTGGDWQKGDGTYKVQTVRGYRVPRWWKQAHMLIPEKTRIAFAEQAGWMPVHRICWDKKDSRRSAPRRPSDSYEDILVFAKSPQRYWNKTGVLHKYSKAMLQQMKAQYNGKGQLEYTAHGQEDPSEVKRNILRLAGKRKGSILRAVWEIPSTQRPKEKVNGEWVVGWASFPILLPEICVCLATEPGDVVLDPYCGMSTTLLAAARWGRDSVGIELNSDYVAASKLRLERNGFRPGDYKPLIDERTAQRGLFA